MLSGTKIIFLSILPCFFLIDLDFNMLCLLSKYVFKNVA